VGHFLVLKTKRKKESQKGKYEAWNCLQKAPKNKKEISDLKRKQLG
jgi:hypothetical protein